MVSDSWQVQGRNKKVLLENILIGINRWENEVISLEMLLVWFILL